jgi:hypothetical protein
VAQHHCQNDSDATTRRLRARVNDAIAYLDERLSEREAYLEQNLALGRAHIERDLAARTIAALVSERDDLRLSLTISRDDCSRAKRRCGELELEVDVALALARRRRGVP